MKNKTFSAENQFLFKIFISPPTSTVLPRATAQLFPLLAAPLGGKELHFQTDRQTGTDNMSCNSEICDSDSSDDTTPPC